MAYMRATCRGLSVRTRDINGIGLLRRLEGGRLAHTEPEQTTKLANKRKGAFVLLAAACSSVLGGGNAAEACESPGATELSGVAGELPTQRAQARPQERRRAQKFILRMRVDTSTCHRAHRLMW